jgi:hypothetical protein
MDAFDEFEWIATFFGNGVNLKVPDIQRITNFTFLWNMFETHACGQNASFTAIGNAVDRLASFDIKEFEPHLKYFKERYFDDKGGATRYFSGLNWRTTAGDQAAKAKTTEVLTLQNTDPKEILKGLLYIMYRFRNNLFHGGKQIQSIDTQIPNFKVANSLLAKTMTLMKSQGVF